MSVVKQEPPLASREWCKVTEMDGWFLTAREAVQRSSGVRAELREEAVAMLANGEYEAARRVFDDILQETMPDAAAPANLSPAKP